MESNTITEIKFDSSKFKLVDEGNGVMRLVDIPPKPVTKDFVPARGVERFCLGEPFAFSDGFRERNRHKDGTPAQCKLYYPTEEVAKKAAVLLKRAEEIIRACLVVDPDFEPDWDSTTMDKYFPYYAHHTTSWVATAVRTSDKAPTHVSSMKKCNEVIAILNSRGIK